MRKGLLASVVLLILVIMSILCAIFYLDKFRNTSNKNQSPQAQIRENSKIFVGYDNTSLFLTATLKKVWKKENKIYVDLSTILNDKYINITAFIYDKSAYPIFFLIVSKDPNILYGNESKTNLLKDPQTVYNDTKKLEGKTVEILFKLSDSSSKKEVIDCNNTLWEYLKGVKKTLPCIPFAKQIAVYVK